MACAAFVEPEIVWLPQPKQAFALSRTEDEILYGGARGGMKTDCGIAWLIKHRYIQRANPKTGRIESQPQHPSILCKLRGLVVRKDSSDLSEWVTRAREIYGPLGAEFRESPTLKIEFPDGHIIRGGHLHDKNAYSRYKSQQYQQVVIEELTEIPTREQFKKLLGCNRSTLPSIRAQVFCTTNPDGPGAAWVKKHFVKVIDVTGEVIPPMTPMVDPETQRTRIFIPAKLSENPYLMHNQDYVNNLKAQDEKTRRAWLDGDWDAQEGAYFSSFRAHGPLAGEDVVAAHVVSAGTVELLPWWARTIGADKGFGHAASFHTGCHNQNDGRLHIYREYVKKGAGAEELGAEVAKQHYQELQEIPDHFIPLFLSPDAFYEKDPSHTWSQQFLRGINLILGDGSAFLAKLTEDEIRMADSERAWRSMHNRYRSLSGSMRIVVYPANNRRADGWQYLHGLMRFWPLDSSEKFDMRHAQSILSLPVEQGGGQDACEAYIARHAKRNTEILPKIKVWDTCPKLIDFLSTAIIDEKDTSDVLKFVGDDAGDSGRYLCMGYKALENAKPVQVQIAERLAAAEQTRPGFREDPMLVHQVTQKAIRDSEKGQDASPYFNFNRAQTRRRRFMVSA